MKSFDCGNIALNDWLMRHGWRNQREGVSRTSVLADEDSGRIIGFVSLCTGQIERGWMAKSLQRNKPDPLSVFLLGQLAVDIDFHGRGIGASLLRFALGTALELSMKVGCFGVLTNPVDEDARRFYSRFRFVELPGDPKRGMLLRMADISKSVSESSAAS